MTEPTIIVGNVEGVHNADLDASGRRLRKGKTYRDLSTVCIIPTRGMIPARVVESWWGMMTPMNQKFVRIVVERMEVAAAYNAAVELVLNHPELSKWPYILTLEEDNMPPPDGLLKLYEHIDDFDAVGGLYWTKGEGGQPMIYGDPGGILNFIPQVPRVDEVQECNGLGMGFTLFRTELFRQLDPPWFQTVQSYEPGRGSSQFTQDLHFFQRARELGKRVASDNRVKVGHFDAQTGVVW